MVDGNDEPFVDRETELALISRRLEEARAENGHLIAGEPAIGVTRLAQAAAGAAGGMGMLVVWASVMTGSASVP